MFMRNTRLLRIVRLAALTALQIVLSRFLSVPVGGTLKFSFGFVPVILAGALDGMPGACLVALISDLLGALLFPQGPFFIGYTATAVLSGALYGLFFYYIRNRRSLWLTALVFAVNAIAVTMALNTFCIAFQYGYLLTETRDLANIPVKFWALLPKRALEAAVMLPVQTALTHLLLNVMRLDEKLGPLHPFRAGRIRKKTMSRYNVHTSSASRSSGFSAKVRLPLCAASAAFLAAFALCVNLGRLPSGSGMALSRYLADYVFPDMTLAAAVWALSFLLMRKVQNMHEGRLPVLCALCMAFATVSAGLFSGLDLSFPTDIKRLSVVGLVFIGWSVFYRALCLFTFRLMDSLYLPGKGFTHGKAALLILLCWLPYLFVLFPGTVNPDAYDALDQVMGTLYPGEVASRTAAASMFGGSGTLINDTQPVLHTLLLGGIYALGRKLGSPNAGIFAFVLAQAALQALCASRGLELMSRMGLRKTALTSVTWFYALFPLFPLYAFATLKDTALSIAFLASLIFLAEMCAFPEDTLKKPFRLLGGALCILSAGLFRSFSLWLLLPFTVYALWRAGKKKCPGFTRALVLSAAAFLACASMLYAVYPALGVGKGPGIENRSLMVQQTALYVKEHPNEVTQEEWAVIERVFGTRDLEARHHPQSADGVKYLALEFRDSWADYTRIWMKMGLKHPGVYVRAALAMGSWYWDTRISGADNALVLYAGDYGRFDNGLNNEYIRMTPGYVQIRMSSFNLRACAYLRSALLALSRLPLFGLIFKSGPYLLSLIAVWGWMKARKKAGRLLPLTLILYGLGLMLSPVSGFSRYAYPIMLAFPFAACAGALMPPRNEVQGH